MTMPITPVGSTNLFEIEYPTSGASSISTTTDVSSSLIPTPLFGMAQETLANGRAYRRVLIGISREICGGEPTILGTRISVVDIVDFHYRLGWDIEKIQKEFPQLVDDQIKSALEYYEDHIREISLILQEERQFGRG